MVHNILHSILYLSKNNNFNSVNMRFMKYVTIKIRLDFINRRKCYGRPT